MNAGRMDRLISIVKTTSTAVSDDGAPVMTVSTLSSNVWAEVRPVTGRERFINDAKFFEADTLFTMRHTTVLTELCQILYDGNYYDITRHIDPFDRRRELQVLGKLVR